MAMQRFEIHVDLAKLRRGLRRTTGSMEAVRETIRLQGSGETVNSKRKKQRHEKRRALHGRAISYILRKATGTYAFEPSGSDFDEITIRLRKRYEHLVELAYRTGAEQSKGMKEAALQAAQSWASAVKMRLMDGYMGGNSRRVKAIKKNLIKGGHITAEFGTPPPRGIRSGRWVRGIRGRWRQGRLR